MALYFHPSCPFGCIFKTQFLDFVLFILVCRPRPLSGVANIFYAVLKSRQKCVMGMSSISFPAKNSLTLQQDLPRYGFCLNFPASVLSGASDRVL